MQDSSTWSFIEWAGGILVMVLMATFSLLFTIVAILWSNIRSVEKFARHGDGEIWDSLAKREAVDREFREGMIERVAVLPTKDDNKAMESRIMDDNKAMERRIMQAFQNTGR